MSEFEIWHSRPLAPTRRISLGAMVLPCDPSPGFGGLLIAAVVAAHMDPDDDDLFPDVHRLVDQVDRGDRIVQPRLRHRFQVDRHGLARSTHRMIGEGEDLTFEFQNNGTKFQQVIGAIYAIERLGDATGARHEVCNAVRKAMRWRGPVGPALITHLVGNSARSFKSLADPRAWALEQLGFPPGTVKPTKKEITARFRERVMETHPDRGAAEKGAALAMNDLGEARRILLEALAS
jgi:hypothetical protein